MVAGMSYSHHCEHKRRDTTLSREASTEATGAAKRRSRNEAQQAQVNAVKRVKVLAPTDPDCVRTKPRKRGRPRKTPQRECAEIAIQTDVQINVVHAV